MLLWTLRCIFLFELGFLLSSDEYLIAGYMVVWFLIFWGTSKPFSTVTVPIYAPTNRAWEFPFLHILTNTCYFLFLFLFFFFAEPTECRGSMSQRLNPWHPSPCSDSSGTLTCWATRELLFLVFFFFSFYCSTSRISKYPGLRLNQSCSCRPTLWQHWIWTSSATNAAACTNVGSLTHEQGQGSNPHAHRDYIRYLTC